jgi:hypothetical protein
MAALEQAESKIGCPVMAVSYRATWFGRLTPRIRRLDMQHDIDALRSWVVDGPAFLVFLSVVPGGVLSALAIARIWRLAGIGRISLRGVLLISAGISGLCMACLAFVRFGLLNT